MITPRRTGAVCQEVPWRNAAFHVKSNQPGTTAKGGGMATPSDGFNGFLGRLAASNVATAQDLQGCTAAEIAGLEARYRLRLPASYRRYLELMGHRSGRLFTSDHLA